MWIDTELSGCINGHDYYQEMSLGNFVRTIQSKYVVTFFHFIFPFPFSPFPSFEHLLIALGASLTRNA